jgi:heat shock protein HtpX
MAALFGLFMFVGQLIGGRNGMIMGFGFALLSNFFAYWFSDKMALAMSGAQPVSESEAPGLYRMVGRLATRAGLPMPRVYVIPEAQPNAFATGRNPQHSAVAVTQGLMQALNEDELEGVIAHELAHIKNRDILISSIAATIAGAISFVAQMAFFFMPRGNDEDAPNPLVGLLMMIVAPIAAMIVQMAISRTREFGADKGGAEICGKPMALASALRRIEQIAEVRPMHVNPAASHMYIQNPLGGDRLAGFASLFRTHPPTDERIAKLQTIAQQMGAPAYRAI